MLCGTVGQFSTSRYGLGSWVCLGYCCACATAVNATTRASRLARFMLVLLGGVRCVAGACTLLYGKCRWATIAWGQGSASGVRANIADRLASFSTVHVTQAQRPSQLESLCALRSRYF